MRPSRPASTATGSRPENRLSLTFRLPPSSSADGSGTGGNTRTRGIRILIGESINLIDLSVNYERRLRSNDGWYKRLDLQTPLIQEEVMKRGIAAVLVAVGLLGAAGSGGAHEGGHAIVAVAAFGELAPTPLAPRENVEYVGGDNGF